MKRIFIPTQSGAEWQRLLAKPVLHWKLGRSAMTAAACWEEAAGKLPVEISALLDSSKVPCLTGLDLLVAIPEWQVPLPGGATSSCTDVLAITRNSEGLCIVAVEAKVDEDFGPTVGEKRAAGSFGQGSRLDYLHALLGVEKFDDGIRYQLLHRTASALLSAKDFHACSSVLMIQSFGSNPLLQSDFAAFCKAIGAEELPGGMKVVRSFKNPELYIGWCQGDACFRKVDLTNSISLSAE